VVSANERNSDISRLKLIDLGAIVRPPGDIVPVDRFSPVTTIELLLGLLGDVLSKGRVVVEDRDLLVGPTASSRFWMRKTLARSSSVNIGLLDDGVICRTSAAS
jgi:hypothetical protein